MEDQVIEHQPGSGLRKVIMGAGLCLVMIAGTGIGLTALSDVAEEQATRLDVSGAADTSLQPTMGALALSDGNLSYKELTRSLIMDAYSDAPIEYQDYSSVFPAAPSGWTRVVSDEPRKYYLFRDEIEQARSNTWRRQKDLAIVPFERMSDEELQQKLNSRRNTVETHADFAMYWGREGQLVLIEVSQTGRTASGLVEAMLAGADMPGSAVTVADRRFEYLIDHEIAVYTDIETTFDKVHKLRVDANVPLDQISFLAEQIDFAALGL